MNFIIASENSRNFHLINDLSDKFKMHKFILLNSKDRLNYEEISELNPEFIFFPHWSHIISEDIYENFNCIIFHMTDLPFGRGGSPLQNLIQRSIYDTKISAIKCVKELDAGEIYIQEPLSLYGNAEEIYLRASKVIENMIERIILDNPIPKKQVGEAVIFNRRKPAESNVSKLNTLDKMFDYIRMLDADGYPKAFVEVGNFRYEFSRASLKNGRIIADVEIIEKE